MIISEKQIIQLITLLEGALEENLTPYGREEAYELLEAIEKQQSEELKEVKND